MSKRLATILYRQDEILFTRMQDANPAQWAVMDDRFHDNRQRVETLYGLNMYEVRAIARRPS